MALRRIQWHWPFLLLPRGCRAQAPPVPAIKSTSSEVRVDFVARDKHGHVVRDLRPEEARVSENDVLQQMRALTIVEKGAPAEPPRQPAAGSGKPRKRQELRNTTAVAAFFAGPRDAHSGAGAAVAPSRSSR